MNTYRKFCLRLAAATALFFCAAFTINLYLDPDHIIFNDNQGQFIGRGERRYQNAGIINSYPVENLIVGGSLVNNFVPSEVERALGWKNV